jgi:hypothetical protein
LALIARSITLGIGIDSTKIESIENRLESILNR